MTELVASTPSPEDPERSALLADVRGSVLQLLTELPRLPERVRVSARDIAVELEWPAPVSTRTAPAQPVAAQPVAASEVGQQAPTAEGGQPPPDGPRVTAPTVGTFYRSPEPGAAPFVEVGDTVSPGQQVAILEAMKLMLPVESDFGGVVLEILKQDGQPVEFGEPLFVLEPARQG